MLKNLLGSLFFLLVSFSGFSQTTYNGNTRTGFGGAVGTGSLTLTPSGSNITFNLTRGSGMLNDVVVIYIDSKSGGFSSTSSFTDAADDHRRAISGFNGGDRATLNFPTGFTPDYAIAFNGSFAGLWELTTGSHNFVTTLYSSGPGNSATNYSFTFDKSNIGITGDIVFNFLVTYISGSAFRSDEFIGDAGPTTGNPGYTSYTATSFNAYNAALPVKLKSFDVQKESIQNLLKWTVEEEINLKGYSVERSADGINFSTIGFIKSSGKGMYTFNDRNVQGQIQYYRLALTDEDGSVKYSSTVSVKTDNVQALVIKKVYPNPVSDHVNIIMQSPGSMDVQMQLFDVSGRLIKNEIRNIEVGLNTIQLSLPSLLPGIYNLKIFTKEGKPVTTVHLSK